jgi:hypothetical protein
MPSTVSVKVNKPKWPGRVTIRVGLLEPDVSHPGTDLSAGEILEAHEFGLGNVPERSVIRAGFDELHEEIEQIALQQMQLDPALGAERVAMKAAAMFQNRMTAGLSPDLAESTKKRKEARGISAPYKPLIETGLLKSLIVGDAKVEA